jgi:NAD(P)H-binding
MKSGLFPFLFLIITFTSRLEVCVVGFHISILSAATTASRQQTTTAVLSSTNQLNSLVNQVAVAGASGRTGQLVAQELLDLGVNNVIAIVRDTKKASDIFSKRPSNLSIVQCDLGNPTEIDDIIKDLQNIYSEY